MWKITETGTLIIRRLHDLTWSDPWFGRAKRYEEIRGLLRQLGNVADLGTLPCALELALSSKLNFQDEARTAIGQIVASNSPYDLIHISENFVWYYGWHPNNWSQISPSDVVTVAEPPTGIAHAEILGLLSFHRSGYVRQEAVRHLASIHTGKELPFLLIRANDWVEPIARDAKEAVLKRIIPGYIHHLVRSFKLILHLASLRRRDHQDIVSGVIAFLLAEENGDILLDTIRTAEQKVSRAIIRHGFRLSGDRQRRLVRFGLESNDPIIRLKCCTHITAAYSGDELKTVLDHLTRDAFMPVRREACRFTATQFPDAAKETWQAALDDRSRSIRELARFSLKKLDHTDASFAEYYRDRLQRTPEHVAALEGLAEVADVSDLEFFRVLAKHRLPSRRAIAVRGLVRVSGECAIPDLVPLLNDASPRVFREIRRLLRPHLHLVRGEDLYAVAVSATSRKTSDNAVAILADLGKWKSIPWLLRLAAESPDELRERAESRIVEWFTPPKCNRVFSRPTAHERQQVTSLLEASSDRLSPFVVEFVAESLDQ